MIELRHTASRLREFVAAFDPDVVAAKDVSQFVDLFSEIERLAVAGRTLIARRVERSTVWCDEGFSTPARWMAAKAQTTLRSAITTIETGRRLEELPATKEALRSGALSGVQAAEVAAAATADPSVESRLLDAARCDSFKGLRDTCQSVIAAARHDEDADERIHRSRYLRTRLESDGAFRVDARLAPDAGARLDAIVLARARVFQEQARRAGSREKGEAYAADALVSLADASTPGPRAVVHVHVDLAAWDRGHVEKGERCSIPGVGPVPVAAARRLARDGIVTAVLHRDNEVRAVARFGRTIPAKLRTALEARDVTCVVPGCDVQEGLEIDHIVPLNEGGPTRLDNLARLCRWHHSIKTHRGWRLAGGPGSWKWLGPARGGALRPHPN